MLTNTLCLYVCVHDYVCACVWLWVTDRRVDIVGSPTGPRHVCSVPDQPPIDNGYAPLTGGRAKRRTASEWGTGARPPSRIMSRTGERAAQMC